MRNLFFSALGSMIIAGSLLIFQRTNHYVLYTVSTAICVSIAVNGLVICSLSRSSFYRSSMYSTVVFNGLFSGMIGLLILHFYDEPFVVDAADLLTPYVTLFFLSFLHAIIMLVMIKSNPKLV
ncbi:hypothetical protein ANABIO32_05410 [Rossellomorea marisflavi]|uniref:hypothetical protein n=1 Tax=Rossellomorea marisflavi TaxID=189381 RepID=UPI0025C7EC87|nr:hypothetical protein [Rossellomorea marisflavi]GLI82853.1 hypothetical protein ANABIO32_05410 [Rossellomorea marisflavi]